MRICKEIKAGPPLDMFQRVAHWPYTLFLDSSDGASPSTSRFSYIATRPLDVLWKKEGKLFLNGHEQIETHFFDFLKTMFFPQEPFPHLPPFQGGFAGFFGYDLAWDLEACPYSEDDSYALEACVGLYDCVVAYDHLSKRCWVVSHAVPGREEHAQDTFQDLLKRSTQPPPSQGEGIRPQASWQANMSSSSYKENVQKALDLIHAGDIFQVNISNKLVSETRLAPDPVALYRYLRCVNPAPFSSFYRTHETCVLSCSPERFLKVFQGHVETRPIKGTSPRGATLKEDQAFVRLLSTSPKNRSENLMIVDLLRHDLSKVSALNSVVVPALCRLESYATVHHLVSVVTSILEEGKDVIDLMKACFPGGSITGAPKVQAMKVIADIEKERRGAHYGAIGYITPTGAVDMNLLIRTLVFCEPYLLLRVGAGIVAESSPQEEYDETLVKARSFLDLQGDHPLRRQGI